VKQQALLNEIELIIDEQIGQNGTVAVAWVVQSMLDRHSDITGTDADLHRLCAQSHFRFTTREVLRGRKVDEEKNEPRQSDLFPGYRHLQRRYVVMRGEDAEVVPVEQMTTEELHEKECALRAFAHGAMEHADELADYRNGKDAKTGSA